jgi:N-acetylmuramoyl-L-alanine amidase
MSYPITVNLIPNLPRDAYRLGVGKYEGVVDHSTDTPNATDEAERNYEATHWNSAFVHFFVDYDSITQVANTNYKAWGAGANANPRFVHIELCEFADSAKFQQAYNRYVWLTAKVLHDRGLGVRDGVTLWSHAEVTSLLKGTTHTDPIAHLASHGISWGTHVANVAREYANMDAPVVPVVQSAPSVSASSGEFRIKTIPSTLYYYNKPDWNAKVGTVKAGTVLTVVQTITVAGSPMYKLKSGTYITTNPKYVKKV